MINTLLGTILYGVCQYLYACSLFREIMEFDLNLLWVNWVHMNQYLEMEEALFYETSVNFCEDMRYHISKDCILHNSRPETSNLALFQRPKIILD